MKFLNPDGLWLLIGIPILIIIYLIKAQHDDRQVSSTYIWKLSMRFAKKRLPLYRLRRILLFVLQLLMIVLAALMAAKPVVSKGESNDYIIILDGSASMQTKDEKGNSRFSYAVKEIEALAKDLSSGHTMTVILSTDTASYLIENTTSAEEVRLVLGKAVCAYTDCNIAEAIILAQTACDRVENAKVILYTDHPYEKTGNINVVDLSKNEWNISLEGLDAQNDGENTIFTGSLISYHQSASVTVGLRIDGSTVDAKNVDCAADTVTNVVFSQKDLTVFDTAEIFIEPKDAMEADNCYAICQKAREKYKILLASRSSLYLESALMALGNCQVTVTASLENTELTGHDLYIFDGIMPEEFPTDGSVWLFGTDKLPNGLTVGAQFDTPGRLSVNSKLESDLYDALSFDGTVIKTCVGLVGSREWENILYCNNAPVLVTGKQNNGVCFSVFSFDLHDSNLPLQPSFLVLIRNLVRYSMPSLLKDTDYTVGQTAKISVLPDAKELYLQYPDGAVKELFIADEYCTVFLNETGVYTAVMKTADGGEYADFFVHVPEGEMASQMGGDINIAIRSENETDSKEAIRGIWFWLAIAFLFILLIEWEWYYYEQY